MRAKLGRRGSHPGETEQLLPNLRPEPPFELRLKLPSWASDTGEPVSCYRYERRQEGARRCLRMSVGPQNIGRGPLQMRFSPLATADEDPRMWQRIELSNGDHIERRAGNWEYHPNHGHYHFSGFANLDLLKVGEDGSLTQVGDGHKLGFCLVDFEMAQWERFFQARPNTALNNCGARRNAFMGISRGWIDIYGWGTQGNYVEFSDNTNGRYVVRATVDAQEQILETDETDNVSYALVRVRGDRVRLLERGYGTDPWDPDKEFVDNWWREMLPGGATSDTEVDRLTRLRTNFGG
jgi:Lysyl oxidase